MHIFISYAKKDTRDFATRLCGVFNELPGVTAWMDTSLEAADSWASQIQAEIDRCDYVVVLLSRDIHRPPTSAGGRSFVLKEISYAQAQQKIIIPVMVQLTSLPLQLADMQYIDVSKDSATDGVAKVISDMRKRAGLRNPPQQRTSNESERRPILTAPRATVIAALITGIFGIGAIVLSSVLNNNAPPTQPIVQPTNTAAPSLSPTDTPAVSDTPTDLPTATMTLTPTLTPSPTLTNTPSPSETYTAIPSPTSSNTPDPTRTPTQAANLEAHYPCEGTIFGTASILRIVHSYPSGSSALVRQVRSGDVVLVVDDHLEANRTRWYQIAGSDQQPIGWITGDYIRLSSNCPQ